MVRSGALLHIGGGGPASRENVRVEIGWSAGPGAPRAPVRPEPGPSGPERGRPVGRGSVDRLASPTLQATRGGGVPLPRRDVIRGRRRRDRRQSRRRATSGGRRYRHVAKEI